MITKYISVFEPIGDGTKDRGEKQFCLACGDEGIRKAKGIGSHITVEEFPLEDIARVDCFRGDEITDNMASGAMAGLLLGGVKGAVVGGMLSGGPSKAWWVEIELKDQTVRYFRLYRGSDSKLFLQWAEQCKVKVGAGKPVEPPKGTFSSADEIMKFKQLLDQGIITQEEFEAKKKQLLGI